MNREELCHIVKWGKLIMEIKQLRLLMQLNIGQITAKRAEKLRATFQNRFPMTGTAQSGGGQAFLNPQENQVLLINPDHIMYQFDALTERPNFTQIQQDVKEIFDVLLLDDKITGHSYMISLQDAIGNSFENSLKLPIDVGDWPALTGIGLRFFTNHGQDIWEYKLEPLVQNPTKYFLEALCNHSNVQLGAFIKLATEAYDEFKRISERHFGMLMGK